MHPIIKQLRKDLEKNSNEKTRRSGQNFFKENVKILGVKTAVVSKIGKDYYKLIKTLPKSDIFNLCEELWQSGFMEESFIACNWSYYLHKSYKPEDFRIFENWVHSYISNWASCDTFCNHTVGEFVEMYPEYLSNLKKWAESPNMWVRRASAVSLIVPARKGKFLHDIFEIADILLYDKEDLVQKGYGWMLKVTSQAHLNEVFNFIMDRKATIPRTALRYAIEKMPLELKVKAMAK